MKVDYLAKHSFFSGIDRAELEKVAKIMEDEDYKRGSAIIKEGEVTRGVYLIISGQATVRKKFKHKDGYRDLVVLHPGDAFGEVEFLDIQPAAASVVATEDVKVYMLTNRNLYNIKNWNLQTFTMIILNLARDIARKLRHMDDNAAE